VIVAGVALDQPVAARRELRPVATERNRADAEAAGAEGLPRQVGRSPDRTRQRGM
jgi:hypothetical protein